MKYFVYSFCDNLHFRVIIYRINGDVALIPVSSHFDTEISNLSTSPPSKEDFQKFFCDWQQYINVDVSTEYLVCSINE